MRTQTAETGFPDQVAGNIDFSTPDHDKFRLSFDDLMVKEREGFVSPRWVIGLGRGAVIQSIRLAEHLKTNQEDFFYQNIIDRQVETVRDALSELTPEQADNLEAIIENEAIPVWLKNLMSTTEETSDSTTSETAPIVHGLIAKNADRSYRVSDETLLTFLHLHNHEIAKAQQELDERLPDMKRELTKKLHNATTTGLLPAHALDRLHRFPNMQVAIDDGLQRILKDIDGSYVYDSGNHVITLSPNAVHEPESQTFDHEMVHALTRITPTDQPNTLFRFPLGKLFGDKMLGGLALVEATTDHIASCLNGASPEEIYSKQPDRNADTYLAGRMLLQTLCQSGKEMINFATFAHALFAEDGDDTALISLQDALQRAFPGHDIFTEVSSFTDQEQMDDYIEALQHEKEQSSKAA